MISLTDIAIMLGEVPTLSDVAQSSNVNQWSFYKPINSEKIIQLTEQDIYQANDGFMLYVFNNPSRMIYELQNPNASNIWSYEDRVAPFRLTDFEGYNHLGGMDFNLSWVNTSSGAVGDNLRLEFNFDIQELISNWKYFEGVRSYVDIVLLIYEQGTQFNSGGTTPVWVYKVISIMDYDERINLVIPNVLSYGNYEVRLCFSTATTNWNDGECQRYNENSSIFGSWYAMPHQCVTTFTVTSSPGPGPGPSPTDFFDWVDFETFPICSFDYYEPDLINVDIVHSMSIIDTTKDLNVYIQYTYENRVGGPVSWGSYSFPLNEGDLFKTIRIQQTGPIETMVDAHLPDDIISIKIYAVVTNNQTHVSQSKTWNQQIEKT